MLISLAEDFDPKENYSEAIAILQLIDDKYLYALAMAAYIQNNNLFNILIETGNCTLQFDKTNKMLCEFIGQSKF
jgi:hypothetical protein